MIIILSINIVISWTFLIRILKKIIRWIICSIKREGFSFEKLNFVSPQGTGHSYIIEQKNDRNLEIWFLGTPYT